MLSDDPHVAVHRYDFETFAGIQFEQVPVVCHQVIGTAVQCGAQDGAVVWIAGNCVTRARWRNERGPAPDAILRERGEPFGETEAQQDSLNFAKNMCAAIDSPSGGRRGDYHALSRATQERFGDVDVGIEKDLHFRP